VKKIQRYTKILELVKEKEKKFKHYTEEEIKEKTTKFKALFE
jgi:preprotein translocase subunit SecA